MTYSPCHVYTEIIGLSLDAAFVKDTMKHHGEGSMAEEKKLIFPRICLYPETGPGFWYAYVSSFIGKPEQIQNVALYVFDFRNLSYRAGHFLFDTDMRTQEGYSLGPYVLPLHIEYSTIRSRATSKY